MRRSMSVALVLVLAGACHKGEDKDPGTPAPEPAARTKAGPAKPANSDPPAGKPAGNPHAPNASAAAVGVEAGGIQHDATEGPAAAIAAVTGTVEVRRVGEAAYASAAKGTKLYPGDAVRTGEKSTATIALADQTVIEVAEVSTIGVASRDGTADPASSAAVLAGLARFTVTPRTPGEGSFRVYTPAGVVVTRGTVYGVGVAASGQVRVGIESGTVDVIGLAELAATPVRVAMGHAVLLEAGGTVASPAVWPADDWGAWRDDADAKLEIAAAFDGHAKAMAELETSLVDAYADLSTAATSVASFEASAAASADKSDTASYQASLPEASATIDASFALGGRLEALTWANAAHAELATDLYVRHPDVIEAKWSAVAPRVDAAVLWPKRFEVTATGYLEPLRMQYYVHHPVGRLHAPLVGISVPAFYAKVEPPQLDPLSMRARIKSDVWIAPEIEYRASTRPVWITAPSLDWNAKLAVAAAPPRANMAWYVRPPTLRGTAFLGADVRGNYQTHLEIKPPEPRASLRALWTIPVGMKIRVGAPDLSAAANARARFHVDGGADVRGKIDARVPDVKTKVVVRVPDVRAGVGAKVRAGEAAVGNAGAGVRAGAGADVKVRIDAPTVRIVVPKPPPIKIEGGIQVKGGFKIGN